MKNLYFIAAFAALICAGCDVEEESVAPELDSCPVRFMTSISSVSRAKPVTGIDFADNAEIAVFGTEKKNGEITPDATWMNNVKLTKSEDVWSVATPKNFMKGYSYSFVAYAPYQEAPLTMSELTAVPYTVDPDIAKQTDFMYVAATEKDFTTTGPTSETANVALAFKHALSQVLFEAKTAADYTDYYTVKITKIEIAGLISDGTLNFTSAGNPWTLGSTQKNYVQSVTMTDPLAYGTSKALSSESGDILMLIPQSPASKTLTLTLEVTAGSKGDGTVASGTTSVEIKFPASDPVWEAGHAYTYTITLNLDEKFGWSAAGFSKPTITDWLTDEREM